MNIIKRVWFVPAATIVAILPVIFLAYSDFYNHYFAIPTLGYLFYNLARLWLILLMTFAFWGTGVWLNCQSLVRRETFAEGFHSNLECAFGGAAGWSIGMFLLCALHAYYALFVLVLFAFSLFVAFRCWASSDLHKTLSGATEDLRNCNLAYGIGGLASAVSIFLAVAILFNVSLGTAAVSQDVPCNYIPYYENVIKAHTNAPNVSYIHFFVSKGNGLAFMANILSDVQGASLASFIMLLLSGMLLLDLALTGRGVRSFQWPLGAIALCAYLLPHLVDASFPKGHVVRNAFILYIVVSSIRQFIREGDGPVLLSKTRILVIMAIVVLTPLSALLILPILTIEACILMILRQIKAAKLSVVQLIGSVILTVCILAYNYWETGIPELSPSSLMIQHFMSPAKFGTWVDPLLAYIHLVIYSGNDIKSSSDSLYSAFVLLFADSTQQLLFATLAIGVVTFILLCLGMRRSSTSSYKEAAGLTLRNNKGWLGSLGYLVLLLIVFSFYRQHAGGSIDAFIGFADSLGVILAMVVLCRLALEIKSGWQSSLFLVALGLLLLPMVFVNRNVRYLPWNDSLLFFIGDRSYETMFDPVWGNKDMRLLSQSIPQGEKADLLNLLSGGKLIPNTPFQIVDSCIYIKNFTSVMYGSQDQVLKTYSDAGIAYFLVDVSDHSPLIWTAYSCIFQEDFIKRNMHVVTHLQSAFGDFYLLTLRPKSGPPGEPEMNSFLEKWRAKLVMDKDKVSFASYTAGRNIYVDYTRKDGTNFKIRDLNKVSTP